MIIKEKTLERKYINHLILTLMFFLLASCSSMADPTPYPAEVDWETAVEILNLGDVKTVFQLHNLEVTLVMNDGNEIHTIEPVIDAIFDEVNKCGAPCGNIVLATE